MFGLPEGWIDVRLPISGLVAMPIDYATWLSKNELIEPFDQHWAAAMQSGQHGDALTPFAQAHGAPESATYSIQQ
jgi:hypothetical protein